MTARLAAWSTIKPPVFDVAQYASGIWEDYTRMSNDATKIDVSPLALATAIALHRIHGGHFAAAFLNDAGVSIEVACELLARPSC